MKNLILMLGVPGCGKSYTVNQLCEQVEDTVVASADDFFDALPGGYKVNWKASLLHIAHSKCRSKAEEAMEAGVSQVIIDNTNLRIKDVKPYVNKALECGYEIKVVEPSSPWWKEIRAGLLDNPTDKQFEDWATILTEKNLHGVPHETLVRMLKSWKPYDAKELIKS